MKKLMYVIKMLRNIAREVLKMRMTHNDMVHFISYILIHSIMPIEHVNHTV